MTSSPGSMLRDKTGAPAAAPRTISTPRLLLTKISHSYVPQIFAEYTVNLAAYMATPHPSDPSGTESFVSRSLKLWDEGTDLTFVILSSTDMEFLGVCSICARVAGEPGPKGLPDLGIWIKAPAHGHGYGMEAVGALVNWAKQELDVTGVCYFLDRRNLASRKLIESLGGVRVEGTDGERFQEREGRESLDLIYYQINF